MKLARLLPLSLPVAGLLATSSSPSPTRTNPRPRRRRPPCPWPNEAKPIRVLHLTGGCCHDYEKQKVILEAGVGERANTKFTVVHEGGKGTKYQFPMLKEPGWEKDYDVVLYNICFAHEEDKNYVESITKVTKPDCPPSPYTARSTPTTGRSGPTSEEKLLGVTSPRHGKHAPITVKKVKDHPIMKGFPEEWTTPQGELYHVDKTWDTATALAEGTIDGWKNKHECIWVNQYGKARVFATTIEYHNETMLEDTYLDLVSAGILWVTSHLNDDGTPAEGFGRRSLRVD
ncbi:MAG: ThuA domain-containing protein [Verrucomicrobiales bacterium]